MTSRRKFLSNSTLATGAALVSTQTYAIPRQDKEDFKKLKILVAGAHPDDPETGMGGTISKYIALGHEVTCLYLTTGEAGIPGVDPDKSAKIRKDEALKSCDILKANPLFFGQIDGSCVITSDWQEKMNALLKEENPDMIFTHWPIDTHRDHRICSDLVFDAWNRNGRKTPLYYFEVCTGDQTQNFNPDIFVNIDEVVEIKWKACFVHESQKIKEYYPQDHAKMELFRGLQARSEYGEAFVHLSSSPMGLIP
jgi:LmbE family N-acetylglucosaminyl deacetylase